MADWDKLAERIEAIHTYVQIVMRSQEECRPVLHEINNDSKALFGRIMHGGDQELAAAYVEDVLRRLGEERVNRQTVDNFVRKFIEVRDESERARAEVDDLRRQVRALEETIRKLKGGA